MPCLNDNQSIHRAKAIVRFHPLTFPKFVLQYKTPQNPRAEIHADSFSLLSWDGHAHTVELWGVSAIICHLSSSQDQKPARTILFLVMAKVQEGK